MNTRLIWLTLALAGGGLAAGCQLPPLPLMSLTSTKYTLAQTEKLTFLDSEAQTAVSSTGIQHSVLSDGRMQVVVNIKNRESHINRVQLSAAFRERAGAAVGEETPWETLTLDQNSTEAVRFISTATDARAYTIRVRHAP